jgi:hypothetical protein
MTPPLAAKQVPSARTTTLKQVNSSDSESQSAASVPHTPTISTPQSPGSAGTSSPVSSHEKPPLSYAALIMLAIGSAEDQRLTLNGIYNWIESNYPFYNEHDTSWKVSATYPLAERLWNVACEG